MVTPANNNQADGGRTGGVVTFPGAAEIKIPVMLGIRETAETFGLPVHFIRELVKSGKIIAVQAGSKKIFVNAGSLADYLNGAGGGQNE